MCYKLEPYVHSAVQKRGGDEEERYALAGVDAGTVVVGRVYILVT